MRSLLFIRLVRLRVLSVHVFIHLSLPQDHPRAEYEAKVLQKSLKKEYRRKEVIITSYVYKKVNGPSYIITVLNANALPIMWPSYFFTNDNFCGQYY